MDWRKKVTLALMNIIIYNKNISFNIVIDLRNEYIFFFVIIVYKSKLKLLFNLIYSKINHKI